VTASGDKDLKYRPQIYKKTEYIHWKPFK